MLLDANLLIYAANRRDPSHKAARSWLESVLAGDRRVGFPWQTIGAFLRIATNPRALPSPLSMTQANGLVDDWLAATSAWIPPATERTAGVLSDLLTSVPVSGNLVPDAQIAALAIEHGLAVYSADTDFARFPDVRWINPLTA